MLQQAEFFDSFGRTVTDAFRGVCHYFDRIERPEQLITAAMQAMRVLTDPADTGAVCLAMPQVSALQNNRQYGLWDKIQTGRPSEDRT